MVVCFRTAKSTVIAVRLALSGLQQSSVEWSGDRLESQRTHVQSLGDTFIQCGYKLQLAEKTEKELSEVLRRAVATTGGAAQQGAPVSAREEQLTLG